MFHILLICLFSDGCYQHSTHYDKISCEEVRVEMAIEIAERGKAWSAGCIPEEDLEIYGGE